MQATLKELISLCDELGECRVISALEAIVRANENAQAYYFAEGAEGVKKAQQLGAIIISQNITIARLKAHFAPKEENVF